MFGKHSDAATCAASCRRCAHQRNRPGLQRIDLRTPAHFLLAKLADDSAATIRQLKRSIGASPEVIETSHVTGEADVVLKLQVADMAAYDRFVQRHINRSPLVRRFKTFPVLRSLKP